MFGLFSYVSPESRLPKRHPLWLIRLLESDIARRFFAAIVAQAEAEGLTSDEHYTVDGTLIEAWASLKSIRRKDGSDEPPPGGGRNPDRNFHGEKRSNQTHASTTDPEAQLFRKGKHREAKLYYLGHVLMENRHGLVVDGSLTPRPTASRNEIRRSRWWLDDVAQNIKNYRSAIDCRTTQHGAWVTS